MPDPAQFVVPSSPASPGSLPLTEGLRRQAIDEDDIKRYLGVIDTRVRSARTGARWQLSSWNALKEKATPGERANASRAIP